MPHCDSTLRVTKSGAIYPKDPDDVVLMPGRKEKLQELLSEGWIFCGASNQSGIARKPDHEMYVSEPVVIACFNRTCDLLGVDIGVLYAPERGGVPQTFWRKPLPGMFVIHMEKYLLDPAQCVCVGDLTSDKTFAERSGCQFQWAEDFFR